MRVVSALGRRRRDCTEQDQLDEGDKEWLLQIAHGFLLILLNDYRCSHRGLHSVEDT